MPSTPTPRLRPCFATSAGFPKPGAIARVHLRPTGNLLGMYDIRPKDSGYEAINAFSFMASADEWFSPVVAEVGPDGNLWVADWYNFIIQHNPTPNKGRPGMMRKRRETPTSILIATVNTAASTA